VSGLRVLITNLTLASRTGTELYVRDLALRLLRIGHTPIVYCPHPGEVGEELRDASVAVLDSLEHLAGEPDVIHGHHHPELMTALLRFPNTPAIFVCHDRTAWHDVPPRFPRILRYVAVDDNCRERLIYEVGIPEPDVRVLRNAVDLDRFRARGPLPEQPRRALVFSNSACEHNYLGVVRAACERRGIALDVIGQGVGKPCRQPEEVLGQYDLVFAKARCALEALAVGAAVVLCDRVGVGPLVRTENLEQLRRLNLGRRTLGEPHRVEVLLHEMGRYEAQDAGEVARRVRSSAGLKPAVDALVALYREVIAEHRVRERVSSADELRAAALYLRSVMPFATMLAESGRAHRFEQERDRWWHEHQRTQGACEALGTEIERLRSEFACLQEECRRRGKELAWQRGQTAWWQAEAERLQGERAEREAHRAAWEAAWGCLRAELDRRQAECLALRAECERQGQERARLAAELAARSAGMLRRLRRWLGRAPLVAGLWRAIRARVVHTSTRGA
jgi:hypothetical protein